jgi:flavodoxin/NAD-dependent dihydropyrimidine dehydrogenase PreA subunit
LKCVIIYFSQTGNTEKIAKVIQKGVKQAAGHCDILKIKDANPKRLYEYDLIGIGSAVFGGQLGSVGVFLNELRFVGGKHAFLFCTHGTSPETFFPAAYERMQRHGLTVIGMGDWYGDCYLLHMPEPYPTAGHPDEIDLKEAEKFGKEMVERSRRITAGETDLIPAPPPAPPLPPPQVKDNTALTYSALLKFHKEKCLYPQCRLCMENCPMYGIDLSVDPPVLAKPCLSCEFCARICPTGALDMDEWVQNMANMTATRVSSMILGALEKAEGEGRFRRLIPVDKLNFNTFGYMLHKSHPQWIIDKGPQ